MWPTPISVAIVALLGALLVFAPTDVAAHAGPGHAGLAQKAHVHHTPQGYGHAVEAKRSAIEAKGSAFSDKTEFVLVEARTHDPIAGSELGGQDCGSRGCCSFGHCSACGTAIAASTWSGFRLPAGELVVKPEGSPPSNFAGEYPPRPPRSFV